MIFYTECKIYYKLLFFPTFILRGKKKRKERKEKRKKKTLLVLNIL